MQIILNNLLIQLIFIVGIIIIFGFIIQQCSRLFATVIGRKNYNLLGIIGTPIHELGHAFFCVIFFHKIKSIELYTPNNKHHLGKVEHRYNPKNIYHQIGNYFIGIGPILLGTLILSLFLYFTHKDIYLDYLNTITKDSLNLINIFKSLFVLVRELLFNFNISTLVFFILGICISMHMSLSSADIKSSLIGLFYIFILMISINTILYFININLLNNFTNIIISLGSSLLCILSISLIFCLIQSLLSLPFILLRRK